MLLLMVLWRVLFLYGNAAGFLGQQVMPSGMSQTSLVFALGHEHSRQPLVCMSQLFTVLYPDSRMHS